MATSSRFDNICTLNLPSDLFAQVLHPSLPLVTVGLASGHVYTYRLPHLEEDDLSSDAETSPPPQALQKDPFGNGTSSILSQRRRSSTASENGLGSIETVWKTRRHQGSCRALTYNHDGSLCYSAGTDGLVKCFESETGRVVAKLAIPGAVDGERYNEEMDAPSVINALNPMSFVLGTDAGSMHLFDLREGGRSFVTQGMAARTWMPHGAEPVTAITPIPPSDNSTSGFSKQWISVGGSTLAVTDVRKGVIATSEDQEVALGCLCLVQGLKKGGTSVGEKVLVGQDDGVVSLFERGVWGDIDDRIVVDARKGGGAGVECLAEIPRELCAGKAKFNEKVVAAGLEDGRMRFMRIGRNGIIAEWDVKHDEIDGVVAIGFDANGGRLVSGGGQVVKIWTEAKGAPGGGWTNGVKKHGFDSDDSDDAQDNGASDDDSDDEARSDGRRKKRKRNKGKDRSGGRALDFSGLL